MHGRVLAVAALAGLAFTMAPSAQRAPSGDGLLVGQVVDADSGRPISQALVWLGGPPTATGGVTQAIPTRVLTGSDGRFVLRNLPSGNFTIMAGKSGYLAGASGRRRPSGAARAVPLPDGGRVGDVIVRMWRAGSISGTVSDESGEPLVSVQVAVFRKEIAGGRATYSVRQQLMTDDRGLYRAGGLAPGDYLVAMTAPVMAFPRALTSELPRSGRGGAVVGGAVTIGDFLVQLSAGVPTPPPLEHGRLRAYGPTFHPGTESARQASVISLGAGEDFGGADIQMQPTGVAVVRGEVIGPDAEGPPLMQLTRVDAEALVPLMQGALSPAAGGQFVFPSVADGEYTLRVIGVSRALAGPAPGAPRTLLWAADPVVVSGEDVTVSVVLREGVRISGQVQFDGLRTQPSPGVLQRVPIAVEPADGEPMLSTSGVIRTSSTRVDASGSFTTPGLPGGRYVVRVTNSPPGWMFAGAFSGGRDISNSPVDLLLLSDLDNVVVRFTDRWTGLQGTVRDSQGQADRDATVFVFPFDPSDWVGYGPNPRRLRFTNTSAVGAYAFDPLPPGDYYVIAVIEEPPEWRDPSVLERLSRSATRVTVRDDGKTTMDLRTR